MGQSAQAQEAANFSDTTASAAGSDDEGSTAATDGSTLRTSPAEQGGSAGSESGGSGVESITGEHNVSGRSSAYGDNMQEAITLVSRSDTSSVANAAGVATESENIQHDDTEIESENSSRLHILRLQLLERLIEYLPNLKNVDGVRAIPFLQVSVLGTYFRARNFAKRIKIKKYRISSFYVILKVFFYYRYPIACLFFLFKIKYCIYPHFVEKRKNIYYYVQVFS